MGLIWLIKLKSTKSLICVNMCQSLLQCPSTCSNKYHINQEFYTTEWHDRV